MGFRFRRSVGLGKFARINLGKRGASLSLGVPGARVNFGAKGVRSTVGIPGTGISYSSTSRSRSRTRSILGSVGYGFFRLLWLCIVVLFWGPIWLLLRLTKVRK